MTTSDQLISLLEKHGLSKFADTIFGLAKPALILKKRTITERRPSKPKWFGLVQPKDQILETPASVKRGASKFGGYPDFPLEARWPKGEQGHLDFICQLSCTEIHAASSEFGLPPSGMLYFFFDASDEGSDWSDPELASGLVVYWPSDPPTANPDTQRQQSKNILPEYALDFIPILTVPDQVSPEIDALQLGRSDQSAYERFEEALDKLSGRDHGMSHHQVGGYPMQVQGDVRAELEVFDGFTGTMPDQAEWKRAHELAPAWSLLLQVDSDKDLNLMWGDAGMLYYGIRQQDLAESRFTKSRTTVQCY